MTIRIGVDLDNVLNNLNTEWINIYNKLNNDSLTLEDIKSWDIHKYTKNNKKIYTYLNNALFSQLKPLPYSIEATKNIMKYHELYVVTASYPNTIETKMNWLHKYFPHIPYDNVIICQRKDLVNVDILIDDAPVNILSFPKRVIVMDYAWNRDIHKGIRLKNWYEIEKWIFEEETT